MWICFLGFTVCLAGCAVFVKNSGGGKEIQCNNTATKKYNLVFRNVDNISSEEFNTRLGLLVDSLEKKECFKSIFLAKQDFSSVGSDFLVLDVTFPKVDANFIEWTSGFLSVLSLGIIPMYKKTVKVFSFANNLKSLEIVEYTVGSFFLIFTKGRGAQIIYESIEKETAMVLNFIDETNPFF